MAEKVSQKLQFSGGSCTSGASGNQPVKVVHIQNPTMVKTTASEFRAVVQFHTGRRKRAATDRDESTHMKAPKVEGRSNCNFIPIRAEPEIPGISNGRNNTHGDFGINSKEFKAVEAQSEEFKIFETLESIGDGLYFGQFSPYPFYDVCN